MEERFRELLKPGRIGHLELRNRIIMAPMGTYLAGRDGLVTDRLKSYCEERARGGVGLIIIGVAAVDHPQGKVMTRQVAISDDKYIPGLASLAEAVHKHGVKLSTQLQHGGRIAAPFLSGGHEPVSASSVPMVPAELGVTRELSISEISQLVQSFARAAERAKKAGLDGVEIHGGHGYLVNQFLSRSTNKRQDAYGGDLRNRARFLLEIIQAVKENTGAEYPVWVRLDGKEFAIENGITQQEAKEVAIMAEDAGADAIHVSGYGGSQGVHFTTAPLVNTPGYLVPHAREIKKIVKIPVIAVGRISPEMGENILRRGDADFIAMGRPLLADPELPHKLSAGAAGNIRKCIYCYTCVHQIFVRSNICCAVNPAVGKESDPVPGRPEKVKKVMVVGGGPAGMEAAAAAALRGHQVTLYEKEENLGGSLVFASLVREENEQLIDYLARRIKELNITVKLGEKVTPEIVEKLHPDVVLLAAGGVRTLPSVPGINGKNVINGDDLRQILTGHLNGSLKLTLGQKALLYPARAILRSFLKPQLIRRLTRWWMPLGNRVVILGAGMVGCELAVFLVERGRKVTVVESTDQIAAEMSLPLKWLTLEKLDQKKVSILTEAKIEEITRHSVRFSTKDGIKQDLNADTVIIAQGVEPDQKILAAFQGKAPEVYLVGDCNKLSYIKDSIAEGYKIGSMI